MTEEKTDWMQKLDKLITDDEIDHTLPNDVRGIVHALRAVVGDIDFRLYAVETEWAKQVEHRLSVLESPGERVGCSVAGCSNTGDVVWIGKRLCVPHATELARGEVRSTECVVEKLPGLEAPNQLAPELRERLGRLVRDARRSVDIHIPFWDDACAESKERDRCIGEAVWHDRDAEAARLEAENLRLRMERGNTRDRELEELMAKLEVAAHKRDDAEKQVWELAGAVDAMTKERDAAIKRAETAELERASLQRHADAYAQVCSAIGIEYAPDSGPTAPGPIDAVLEELETMKLQCRKLFDLQDMLRKPIP